MNLTRISQRLEITFWMTAIDVMNDRWALRVISAILILALVFGVFLLTFGFFVRSEPLRSPNQVQVPDSIVHAEAGALIPRRQYNTLVMLVDKVSPAGTQGSMNLKGVWLAAYLPSTSKLMLMPLYAGEDQVRADISKHFWLKTDGSPSPEFFQSIRELDITWDHYIVIDRAAFQEVFAQIYTDNVTSIAKDETTWSVSYQAALANDICTISGDLVQSGEAYQILQGFEGHFYTDMENDHILDLWKPNRESRSRITCEFPTLREMVPAKDVSH